MNVGCNRSPQNIRFAKIPDKSFLVVRKSVQLPPWPEGPDMMHSDLPSLVRAPPHETAFGDDDGAHAPGVGLRVFGVGVIPTRHPSSQIARDLLLLLEIPLPSSTPPPTRARAAAAAARPPTARSSSSSSSSSSSRFRPRGHRISLSRGGFHDHADGRA